MLVKNFIVYIFLLNFCVNIIAQVPPNVNSGNPNFPFPQFKGYVGGANTLANKNPVGVPHAEMEQRMKDAYQNICNNMIYTGETVGGVRYIRPNNALPISHCTCVEADGYYLLAAAYMGDKTTYDGYFMWMHDRQFQKTERYIDGVVNSPGYNYSPGISGAGSFGNAVTTRGGALGGNSAADGDVDVALAMLMAWKQWGDMSGITPPAPYTGGQISYKAEAIKYIRTMVDTLTYAPSLPIKKYISGDIGLDGYMKSGDTWNETSIWAQPGQPGFTVLPERTGGQVNYADYFAPAYFRSFADMLQAESQPTWSINQYRRGEASCDWVTGQAYNQGLIPWIGHYTVSAANAVTFSTFNAGGEDFRYGWRTILNYLWHGAPTYSWNPATHQTQAGSNTYNLLMAQRFATFLKNPSAAPYNNPCFNASASVPGLNIGGPANIRWEYAMNGTGGGAFSLPMPFGPASPSAVVAGDWDLMSQLFRQCVIVFDDAGGGGVQRNTTATPQYFHEWFRLLGMLVLTGNLHEPLSVNPAPNLKIYKAVNKTYAYVGDTVTYTISYRNYGKNDATSVEIKDTLDAGYTYLAGSSNKAVNVVGNILTWNIGTVKGMNTGNVNLTRDSLKFSVVVNVGAPSRICNTSVIREAGAFHWKSNEYPNRITDVMERNCVDILGQKPLTLTKTVDKATANPGDVLTYTVKVKNKTVPFLNGGRQGVIITGANDAMTTSQSSMLLKYRIIHGAHEPLINYRNYRISYYVNQNPIPTWAQAVTVNEGSATTPTLSQQVLPSGPTWNHRFILRFPNQQATTTYRLTDNRGDQSKIHEGALSPMRMITQLNAGWVNFNALDDWSAEPTIAAADGAAYFPFANDWTDPLNPNLPVSKVHPDACNTITTTVTKQLAEEWDGYTWRRIYGNAPISGMDLLNVKVSDVLPPEVDATTYTTVSGPAGTRSGSTITWPTIAQMLPGDSVVYVFTVKIKTPCPGAIAVNTAYARATNEPLSTATATTNITGCATPTNLLDFSAKISNSEKVKLNWTTSNETIGEKYEIELSNDGVNFNKIAQVVVKKSSSVENHEIETNLLEGKTHYRILYFSNEGKVINSKIETINNFQDMDVLVYPNPFTKHTTIKIPESESNVEIQIINSLGAVIYDKVIESGNSILELSNALPVGVYYLKVNLEQGSKTIKLISE